MLIRCSVEVDSSGVHVGDLNKWGHCDMRTCSGGGRTGAPIARYMFKIKMDPEP